MKCEDARTRLTAAVDGELDCFGEVANALEEHLAACAECRKLHADLAAIGASRDPWQVEAVDMEAAVLARVALEEAGATAGELASLREEVRALRAEVSVLRRQQAARMTPASGLSVLLAPHPRASSAPIGIM